MASGTFCSRILGIVREQVMANYFGASRLTDAFLVAYKIPNMLRDLFAEGAFSAAFVPIFTKAQQQGRGKAQSLLWSVFWPLVLVTGIISVLMIFFAPQLVLLVAPKFADDPQKLAITIGLLQIMAPFLVLVSISAIFMGILNVLQVFFIPSFAPVFFNLMMISATIWLPPYLEKYNISGIYALALGVMAGGLAQLLVQVPWVLWHKLGPTWRLHFITPETKQIMARMGIGSIGIAASQINLVVNTILASSLGVGAVSWLSYAFRLFQLPIGILGVSIAGSNLVHFSACWKRGDHSGAINYLQTSYQLTWPVILWAMSLLLGLGTETVHLVFERGAFTSLDTNMTTVALRCYLLGLPFYGMYKIFVPVFYVIDRPRIPILITIGTTGVNIVFCILAVSRFGHGALAMGTSLSMFINAMLQAFFLKKILRLPWHFYFTRTIGKYLLSASVCFVFLLWSSSHFFHSGQSVWIKLFRFGILGMGGTLLYFALLRSWGEGKNLISILRRRNLH